MPGRIKLRKESLFCLTFWSHSPSRQERRGGKTRKLVTWHPRSGSREESMLTFRFLSLLYTCFYYWYAYEYVSLCGLFAHKFRCSQRPEASMPSGSWSYRQMWAVQHRFWNLNSGRLQEQHILSTLSILLSPLYLFWDLNPLCGAATS